MAVDPLAVHDGWATSHSANLPSSSSSTTATNAHDPYLASRAPANIQQNHSTIASPPRTGMNPNAYQSNAGRGVHLPEGSQNIAHAQNSPASSSAQSQNGINVQGQGKAQPSVTKKEVQPYLRVRIIGLERNRKDMLIRFDASTNLPQFRATMYKNMQRSYVEFQLFASAVAFANPHAIVPALPLPQTSAATDEEDDRLVKISLQRWLLRICEDPVLQRDEELRSFIESDFGYQPTPRSGGHSRSISSSTSAAASTLSRFSSISKVFRKGGPPDEDEDLQLAKGELEKLEEKWLNVSRAVVIAGKSRRALANAQTDEAAKFQGFAVTEVNPDLGYAFKRLGKTWENLAGLLLAQSISDNIVLGDSLAYQASNAKAAKETLNYRTQILQDAQDASKTAINKRRTVERMKGSSNISAQKVDEALEDLQEAQEEDANLSRKVAAISRHLRSALQTHSRQVHDDAAVILLEHAKSRLIYEKQALKELEALRPDIKNIGRGVAGRRGQTTNLHSGPSFRGPVQSSAPPDLSFRRGSQSMGSQPQQSNPRLAQSVYGIPQPQPQHQQPVSDQQYPQQHPSMAQSMMAPSNAYPQQPQQPYATPPYPIQQPPYPHQYPQQYPQQHPQPYPQQQPPYQQFGPYSTNNQSNPMSQSMYSSPASQQQQQAQIQRRKLETAAARSLANMF